MEPWLSEPVGEQDVRVIDFSSKRMINVKADCLSPGIPRTKQNQNCNDKFNSRPTFNSPSHLELFSVFFLTWLFSIEPLSFLFPMLDTLEKEKTIGNNYLDNFV